VSTPEPGPGEVCDSVEMARLILATVTASGADARELARDADLPDWALADREAMVPSGRVFRLWELAEHAVADPYVGLRAASRHRLGDLDLYDYLFSTAATLKDGLEASGSFSHLVTTNGRLQVEADTDNEITYSYQHVLHDGRGEELCLQFVIAGYCARIRAATGRPVTPARMAFAQPAPRSHRVFIETFGTCRIDFGAPLTTFTLRAADRDLPMPGADPVLAGILKRFADSLPAPPQATWGEYVQGLLAEAMERGSPSLDTFARRLAVSRRTLQRQFAEHGTTWRAELDTARRCRAERARHADATDMTRLTRQLGYADPRSARRALQRWAQAGGQQDSGRQQTLGEG